MEENSIWNKVRFGFMGLEDDYGVITSNSIWNKTRFGEGVIIENLDTGHFPYY